MESETLLTRSPQSVGPGRALLIEPNGRLFLSRRYTIYFSDDDGLRWTRAAAMPTTWKRTPSRFSRLAARLLRAEVRSLATLSGGALVATNREWIFHGRVGDEMLQPSQVEDAGQPVMTPHTMTTGPDDVVVWGEYNPKAAHGLPVRIYASDDCGAHFSVVNVIEGGSIMHVHSLLFDRARDHYWVFTGDFDEEPGIGILSRDLRHFEWFVKGEQRYRLCEAFDFGDRFVYATDTPLEQNYVLSLNKDTGATEKLLDIENSSIYACRIGPYCVFSTTVESSSFNESTRSSLWASRDGEQWTKVLAAEKDRWHRILFQFGALILPRGISERPTLFFSGQAVRGYDGHAFVAPIGEN